MNRTVIPLLVVVVSLFSGAGCHNDLGLPCAPVKGTVRYRGEPLPGGTVVFHPMPPTPGPQAMGIIGPDGTFEMSVLEHPGAAVGEHRVTVDYRRELTKQEAQNLVIPQLLIPRRYARVDSSPLTCTVIKGQTNRLPIDLVDD